MLVAAAGMEDRHSRAAGAAASRAGVPDVPGQGPDPAEPVNVPAVDW